MFDEYYYIDLFEEPIYFSIITINQATETSLYRGHRLAKRKSLQRGIHLLQKDNMSLKVEIKRFKVIPEFKLNNEIIVAKKLKRKELKKQLEAHNINNEINPKKRPKEPYNYKSLKTPAVLFLLGTVWKILFQKKGGLWILPSMIAFVLAFVYIFSGPIDRIPDRKMESETKGKLKFVVGMVGMIISLIIIDKLSSIIR